MRKLLTPLILATLGFGCVALFAKQAQAKCLDRKSVEAVLQDFEFYDDDKPVQFAKLDLCNSESTINATLSALSFLKNYSFLPVLSTTAEQLILGQDAFEYFKQRIERIQITSDGVGLCVKSGGGELDVAAYYDPSESVATMHICKTFPEFDLLTKAAVLVHEARHTEGFGHVDCARGPLKGEKIACDTTYKLRGSYATEVEYKIRLAKHGEVDPIMRHSARVDAVRDLFERFNDAPMGLKEVALVQAEDGSVYGYDGNSFEKAGLGTATQVMVDREGEPILFDPASGAVKTYSLGQATDTDGWLAARFRETAKGRTDFKDAIFTAGYHCLLFRAEMLCGPAEGPNFNIRIRFSRLRPIGFLYRSESALIKEFTPYLVGDNGLLYPLPVAPAELARQKESGLQGRRSKMPLFKLSPSSSQEQGEYVLTQDGRFLLYQEFSDGTRSFNEIGLPDGLRLKSVVSPLIWSKDLRTL